MPAPGLGTVMSLSTTLPAIVKKLKTTFELKQNSPERVSMKLVYTPGTHCELDCTGQYFPYGPYEFDLDQLIALDLSGNTRRFLVVIAGYWSDWTSFWKRDTCDKWLELDGDSGGVAIEVDWPDLSKSVYDQSVANTVLVARQVTILLHYLAELSGTHLMDADFLSRVHLVGHSLGSHISAFVGKDLHGKLGRITALDPAGPSFDKQPKQKRLHRSDARLVEVMHTNMGRLRYLNWSASASLAETGMAPVTIRLTDSKLPADGDAAWFGFDAQLGHIDYYANNGRIQPGCKGALHLCDHFRAHRIYLDLLEYRCMLRRSNSQSVAGSHVAQASRLRAYKSPDYESFASGYNFVQHCPQVMDIETHLSDKAVLETFNRCSVPLFDITKPLDEYIDELKTEHGIDFSPDDEDDEVDDDNDNNGGDDGDDEGDGEDKGQDEDTSFYYDDDEYEDDGEVELRTQLRKRPSFYFKTTPLGDNLVDHHYLLKVYLVDRPNGWREDKCALELEIIMPDGDKIHLEVNRLLQFGANQTILALPFIYQKTCKSKNCFNDMMRIVKLVDQESSGLREAGGGGEFAASSELRRLFVRLFPDKIRLNLCKPKSTSVRGTIWSMTKNMVKKDEPVGAACKLTTDMIEVHPLVYGLKRNFGALYGRNAFVSDDRLQVISASELVRRRSEPASFVTTLTGESFCSFTLALESAVVG